LFLKRYDVLLYFKFFLHISKISLQEICCITGTHDFTLAGSPVS